ncbi:MAG: DUF1304 domain-containing protein [Coriobacteriaceae bacterium]|nr:DUF1304 domain-containing protein [Coriobacteriaceae bacterium]
MDILVGRAVFRVAGMVLVALAAALHVFIAGVEMLGWTGPVAHRFLFLTSPDKRPSALKQLAPGLLGALLLALSAL